MVAFWWSLLICSLAVLGAVLRASHRALRSRSCRALPSVARPRGYKPAAARLHSARAPPSRFARHRGIRARGRAPLRSLSLPSSGRAPRALGFSSARAQCCALLRLPALRGASVRLPSRALRSGPSSATSSWGHCVAPLFIWVACSPPNPLLFSQGASRPVWWLIMRFRGFLAIVAVN